MRYPYFYLAASWPEMDALLEAGLLLHYSNCKMDSEQAFWIYGASLDGERSPVKVDTAFQGGEKIAQVSCSGGTATFITCLCILFVLIYKLNSTWKSIHLWC
jgi:hypothetical protein